jgi:MinD-like ATPase involved in chromosome partitioning or flagellar assembly
MNVIAVAAQKGGVGKSTLAQCRRTSPKTHSSMSAKAQEA